MPLFIQSDSRITSVKMFAFRPISVAMENILLQVDESMPNFEVVLFLPYIEALMEGLSSNILNSIRVIFESDFVWLSSTTKLT